MSKNTSIFLKVTIIMGIAGILCLISTNKNLEKNRLLEAGNRFKEYNFKHDLDKDVYLKIFSNRNEKQKIMKNNSFLNNFTYKDPNSIKPTDKIYINNKTSMINRSIAIENPLIIYHNLFSNDSLKNSKSLPADMPFAKINVKENISIAKELPSISVKNIKPRINLRRNKYLFPILSNGPNNQLMGLRESIYIAIMLNRTLVMPFFRKHRTDR